MNSLKTLLLASLLWLPSLVLAEGRPELPEDLVWETNNSDPIFASPQAERGGRFRSFVTSFPMTLRLVGPDSNSSFAMHLRANALGLVAMHPDTRNPIPQLATHWAFDDDGKTVYYRLDPDARWSDGVPVTADDYLFTLEFMRSPHIVAPWYNNHYTNILVDVVRYDDHTISVHGAVPKPRDEMLFEYGLRPTPRHFHQLDENWVRGYNWKIEPVTGPYLITRMRKGKYVEFERLDDWWGNDKRYFRHRYNPDYVLIKVIRDVNIAYQHFTKGDLDSFGLIMPRFWHKRAQGELYDSGYIGRVVFYNDVPQPALGLYLNESDSILSDRKVRYALAHALNVEKVIETVLHGDYERLQTMHEGYGEYSNPNIRAREFDIRKANDYLEQAGWTDRDRDGVRLKDGRRLTIRITYYNSGHGDRLVILQQEARKAGINLQLQLLDASTAFKQILEKKHQAAWMGWAGGGIAPVYWQFFHSDNADRPQTNNITNTSDPELDDKIIAYRDAQDRETRIRLAHELEQMVHDRGSVIPTFKVPYTREAFWRWLRLPEHYGTRMSDSLFDPFGSSGGLFWIDEAKREEVERARSESRPLGELLIIDKRWRN